MEEFDFDLGYIRDRMNDESTFGTKFHGWSDDLVESELIRMTAEERGAALWRPDPDTDDGFAHYFVICDITNHW